MHVMVAEQRPLPAAEGMEGHGHGDRHVDADHADLAAGGEVAGRIAVAGEDGGAVAVLVTVDQLQRRFVVRASYHREHRAEDLFLVDLHVGLDLVEQTAADEVAFFVALQLQTATVHGQFGAFLDAGVHVAGDPLQGLLGDQRPHLGFRIAVRADLETADLRCQAFHQRVARLADRDCDRNGHAALAGRAVGRAHQGVGGLVHVGVGHHDHVVLGAAQRLHPLIVRRALVIDVLGDRRGADEADRLDVRVPQDRVDRFLVAVDDVENALRQSGFQQQLGQQERRGGIALAGLQDEAVAAGQRNGEHPHRHHGRKVERRDAGDHAQRLAQRVAVHAGSDAVGELALQKLRDAAGELHHLDAAGDLARRIGQHLAVFTSDQRGQLVAVGLQQLLEPEHHPRAIERCGRRPGRERRLGGLYGQIDLARRSQRDPLALFAGGRIEHRAAASAAAGDDLAADEMVDRRAHGVHLLLSPPQAGIALVFSKPDFVGSGSCGGRLERDRLGRKRFASARDVNRPPDL